MEKPLKTLMSERTDKRDVFISYHLADGKIARKLCDKLEAAGISVWYATRDIMPWDNWENSMEDALQQCRVFIVIFSEISMRSEHVLSELETAFRRLRRHDELCVLPVLVEAENLPDILRYYLTQMQFLDARNQPLDEVLDSVVKRVQDILNAQQESAS